MLHDPDFVKLVEELQPQVKEITLAELNAKPVQQPPLLLIDVREDHEWAQGNIPGAIHLGRGILERDIANKVSDKAQELVLYCGGGYRSILAAFNLTKMGYSNVYSLIGGYRQWKDKN